MDLPAVVGDETMPKESWLVDFCRAERQQGRKVLIYLRQTGTRDIQDRILKDPAGWRGARRSPISGVNPRKREEWIARRVMGLDALVVNPRLVADRAGPDRFLVSCVSRDRIPPLHALAKPRAGLAFGADETGQGNILGLQRHNGVASLGAHRGENESSAVAVWG